VNLNFGLATKARACKGAGQEGSLGVTSCVLGSVGECEGMNFHTSKRVSILRIGVLMDPQWTFEPSGSDCKGQKPLNWNVFYIIEKLLEHKFLKWAHMTCLDTSNTSYGQNKGWELNWQFDSWPLKVGNRFNFLLCRWCTTYGWKVFDEGYNFASDFISIEGLHIKLWAPKSWESQLWEFWDS
jgi:hypothetical protein